MLVHICCSVDSHYFLQKLQKHCIDEELIGFFYDPNIHPYSEYKLRLLDVQRSCNMLGIKLIEGEYDYEGWLKAVRGLEHEPEKGARCSICFDSRFEATAKLAQQLKQKRYTSTLLTSPKKSLSQLELSGNSIGARYGVEFVAFDFRKNSGTQEQNILAKRDKLYRQDYCGCMFALNQQRTQQNKISDELFSPISNQIQPESIEYRLQMYQKRLEYEEKDIKYKIVKQRFLNYRLLKGYLKIKKEITPAHFLPYSVIKNGYTRGKIEYSIDKLHYLNRDEVKFVSLKNYNLLTNSNYNSVMELIYNPPSFEIELKTRYLLNAQSYDLSTIIVVDEIPTNKLEIVCDAKVFEDVKEVLIKLNHNFINF